MSLVDVLLTAEERQLYNEYRKLRYRGREPTEAMKQVNTKYKTLRYQLKDKKRKPMAKVEFAETGSIVIVGSDQSWQSQIGKQNAANSLIARGSAVYLTNTESEGRDAQNAMEDYLKAIEADPALLGNCHYLHNYRTYRTALELKAALDDKHMLGPFPVSVVIDCARTMGTLQPGMHVLSLAQELGAMIEGRVIVTGSWGSDGMPKPDPKKFRGDQVWVCDAGPNLALALKQHIPVVEHDHDILTFKGKVCFGGQIVFGQRKEGTPVTPPKSHAERQEIARIKRMEGHLDYPMPTE